MKCGTDVYINLEMQTTSDDMIFGTRGDLILKRTNSFQQVTVAVPGQPDENAGTSLILLPSLFSHFNSNFKKSRAIFFNCFKFEGYV